MRLFFFSFFFCAVLCRLFFCLCFVIALFLLLLLCIVHANPGEFMTNRHDGVAQEHAASCAAHDGEEVPRRLITKARGITSVADGFCDAVRAAVNLCEYCGEECRAARAELV